MSARLYQLCRTYACHSATSAIAIATTAVLLASAVEVPTAVAHGQPLKFQMVRSAAAEAANCLANVHANVQIEPLGPVERMTIVASGLPRNTEFDLFVIQVPNTPFGLSWYQGDMDSNGSGVARGQFIGRFNIETFIVAPKAAPAPVVHDKQPFRDGNTNPATPPVHTFHLGLWFNSPEDAVAAGCSDASETPFNGDHTAGIQVLSTRNFADDMGPLRQLP